MSRFKDIWKSASASYQPKLFSMFRSSDESGVSGVGKVLDGVIFPCGKVAVCWDPQESRVDVNSVAVYDSFDAFREVHIGQHPTNGTEVKFLN